MLAETSYFDRASAENFANGVMRTTDRSTQRASMGGVTLDGFAILNLQISRGRLFLA